MRITRHLAKVALAAIATTSVTGFVGQPRTSDAAPSAEPALLWLESELTDNGGAFDFPPFPPFPPSVDWGLTIDVIIALSAGGRGGAPAATTATAGLAEHINDYVTGDATGDPGSHYAGPIGKSMLAASLQGADVHSFGGVDLEALSRASIQKSGTYVGRFTDVSTFGDFSNGFGQALNILALSRTSAGVPSIAADFLLDQQCPSGGFRLFYDAVDPANSTRGCESGDEADTDATAFSLQAVLALDPGPTTSAAIANAATFLIGQQDPATGGFRGTGPTAPANSNTTGIAAQALEAAGFAEAAALARAYIESLQLDAAQTTSTPAAGEDGAIALNPGAFDDALASGIAAPQRDQWRRATAQAVLGLDLPELAIPRADPVPLRSARLLDTRAGESTIDGTQRGAGLIPAGSTVVLPVAGRGGVPDDASAVVLNVTAVDGLGVGFVTVFPCSTDRPLASSLNFGPGATIANAVIAGLSTDGTVCLFVGTNPVHLIADVSSYFPATSGYQHSAPARLLDTRAGESTIDGTQVGGGPVTAGSALVLPIADRGGVPADADAVVLNVTAVGGQGLGFVTVYACDASPPLASNLNFVAGTPVANAVVTGLSAEGTICLYVGTNEADLVADVSGYFPAGSGYKSLVPARLLETRPGESTVDGAMLGDGLVAAGSTLVLSVAGRGGVPIDASSVVLNVTAVGGLGTGFVTVFPCDVSPPLTSNLNFVGDTATPNAAIVGLSAAGTVCLLIGTNPVHLVVDVSGHFG